MEKLTAEQKKELEQKANKAITELNETERAEELIKDNKIEFEVKGAAYRIRFPNFKERAEIRKARSKVQTELLDEGIFLSKQKLIEKLQKAGIDIKELEDTIFRLRDEKEKLDIRHVEADGATKKEIRKQLVKVIGEMYRIQAEINNRLDETLENEVISYSNIYHLWTVLEQKVEDKWVKAYDKFDDFYATDNEELVIKATHYNTLLVNQPNYEL